MLAENRPNAPLLGYPVASMDGPQNTFFTQLLTGKENPTAEDMKMLDAFGAIDANPPAAFLFATVKDRLTPYGARAIVNAYAKAGVDDELHLFQFGPIVWVWARQRVQTAVVSWLRKILGEPMFADKSNRMLGHYLKERGIKMPASSQAEPNQSAFQTHPVRINGK